MLSGSGFKLRKWCANHPRLLQDIAKEDKEIDLDFGNENNASIKALGLTWQPNNDRFCVKTNLNSTNRITKRIVTSDLVKLFDPLGIMAPVVVTAKIFVQELWLLKLSWDESLPVELHTRWMQFRENLKTLNNFHFSRHMFNNDVPANIQIHTFSDASEKAYGTVVYLRAILKNGTILVRLLCSKSRIAPLKRQTLPRLELCAAVLGAQLTDRVKNDLNLKDIPSFLWTDSEIVLAWINSSSASFQTFVANRVANIQRLTLPEQWRHVSSKQNPADVISRGLQPQTFTSCTLWFYGPLFLHGQENVWPAKYSKNMAVLDDKEKRGHTVATIIHNCDQNMIYKINHRESFNTLQRIIAYIRRFCNHARNKEGMREIHLTTRELEDSLLVIVRAMQAFDFKEEICDLQKYKELKRNSLLPSLAPFLDVKGIVRVGGRLDSGLLPFDSKHPMLLPYNNPLTKLLMKEIHEKHNHCGSQTLLAQMRQRFWPIKGTIMARSIVHHCVKCTRARPQLLQQIMGNLPEPRITPARPFINSGVDYYGPFWIHYKVRGKRPQKAYVAIFCCFATKAVHIELVSDLTTESFLGALKRFIGRRGHCQNIYCDNATNFMGANNQLSELFDTIYSESARETITKECSGHAIQFNFIPPRGPHFGGLWEAAVKSAKHLLKRSVSTAPLTYEELETVLIGIEAILNSRPLTPLSSDPNDLTALTPGHFLIGEPLTAKTDANTTPVKQTLLTRWNLVSHLKQEFWKRWSQEYLQELQYRYKWNKCSTNIKVGDMVIIKEDNVPSLQWPLGRIVKTFKGDDGAIRVVEVKTASGFWKRPIHRLAPLPIEHEVSDLKLRDDDKQAENNDYSSEPVHEIPTKKRKTSAAMGITSLLTILLIIPLVMSNEIQINKFKSNLGIHFEGIGTAKIATSEWNFIIHYNLDPLLEEYSTFANATLTLNHLCQQMQQRSICSNTLKQFQHIQTELNAENTIFTTKRIKRGAANFIGNIANSLFGVLDSKYANQMIRTIDQVKENENHLLHLLRNQTSVIDSTVNVVRQNEEIINNGFDQINNQLREITSRIRDNGEESHQLKIFQIFTSLSSQLILMIINIQRMQSTLIDVLTDTHHGKVSSLLMSARQLKEELKTIKAHLPSFLELPVDEEDLVQLYKLMTVKGGVTDRQAVFWITLPLVNQEFYEIFKMTSIPSIVNNTILTIDLCAPILAVNAHRDQYLPMQSPDMESCINLRSEQFLCFNLQARYSKGAEVCSCELGLFDNQTKPTCSLKKSETNSIWIQMEHKNQWLYFTKNPSRLTAICGRRNLQMELEGSGLLTLQSGCIFKQDHITIEGHNLFSTKLQTSYTSFGNISDISATMHHEQVFQTFNSTQYKIQFKNFTDLHNLITDQEILELPHKLQIHTYHNATIGYLALISIIALIIYLIYKRKSSVIYMKPIPKPRKSKQESDFKVTVT